MANFTTHIATGIVVSGVVSTLALAASVVSPGEVITLVGAGALGSVLPDVDLKDSRASQMMFSGLGVFLAFAVLFHVSMTYSLAEMWILWVATYLIVRYAGHNLFHNFAAHRGVFHSILAGIVAAFATAITFEKLFGATPTISWLAAVVMLVGFVTHLVLDELYSVDVLDHRIKSSFGSALKLYDSRHLGASGLMALAAVGLFFLTPAADTFLSTFGSHDAWAYLNGRLLPEGKWFGMIPGLDHWVTSAAAQPPAP